MATGNAESRSEGRKRMAEGMQGQAIEEDRTAAGQREVHSGRGKDEEYGGMAELKIIFSDSTQSRKVLILT